MTVRSSQSAMSGLTTAYMARIVAEMGDTDVDEPEPPELGDLRGVPAEEIYRRPFHQLWTELDRGAPLEAAVDSAERRAVSIATTDLELAQTHTVRESGEALGVVGYRRVLTGAENCGLCVIASTQRYHRRELMPIHPGCDCAVAPILGDRDPGQIVNTGVLTGDSTPTGRTRDGSRVFAAEDVLDAGELLDEVHEQVKRTLGKSDRGGRTIDYRKVATVYEHGELGPVLKLR